MRGLKILIFLISLLSAGNNIFAEEKTGISINGSSTVEPIVKIAARVYTKKHGIFIKVEGGGSSKGIESAGEGKVDIGMASRYLKNEEKKKYPLLIQHVIGYDGIAIIVNSNNTINNITFDHVRDIYSGRIKNWKEIGGPDMPIVLISKEEGRSTLDLFIEHFKLQVKTENNLIFYKKKEDADFSSIGAHIAGQNSEVISMVEETPGAIGYVSIGAAERAERRRRNIKRLSLDGIQATRENVISRTYPIIRPLSVVIRGKPSGNVKTFIDYLLSPEGQKIVKNLDYIPIH